MRVCALCVVNLLACHQVLSEMDISLLVISPHIFPRLVSVSTFLACKSRSPGQGMSAAPRQGKVIIWFLSHINPIELCIKFNLIPIHWINSEHQSIWNRLGIPNHLDTEDGPQYCALAMETVICKCSVHRAHPPPNTTSLAATQTNGHCRRRVSSSRRQRVRQWTRNS